MTDATIQATHALLEGYCGPIRHIGGGRVLLRPSAMGDGYMLAPLGWQARGPRVVCESIRLDLTQRLAYLHTIAVVAERVGLDPSGGVLLRRDTLDPAFWWVECRERGYVFEVSVDTDGQIAPTAYPQALAAIWRELEEA